MDDCDERVMSDSFGEEPWSIDAAGVSLARCPRLYWIDWELLPGDGVEFQWDERERAQAVLHAELEESLYLQSGWHKVSHEKLPTFITSRPRETPGYKPAGVKQCSKEELESRRQDAFRFPPYQYQNSFCVGNKKGDLRLVDISEREVIMGFPRGYTMSCYPKGQQGSVSHLDERLTLVGNAWNVTVVAWILSNLGSVLGLNQALSVQDVVNATAPGNCRDLQTFFCRGLL